MASLLIYVILTLLAIVLVFLFVVDLWTHKVINALIACGGLFILAVLWSHFGDDLVYTVLMSIGVTGVAFGGIAELVGARRKTHGNTKAVKGDGPVV